jgi:two-component system chemotaxis response regulator CheB
LGVILTGMGKDGAAGLGEMRNAGACTIGQDEATSLVYGMPRVARELGAVEKELPLAKIPPKVLSQCQTAAPTRQNRQE